MIGQPRRYCITVILLHTHYDYNHGLYLDVLRINRSLVRNSAEAESQSIV
jgi:hypothetical protein